MADLVIVATIGAFIARCVAYVEWCDRIVRHDEDVVERGEVAEPDPVVTP